MSFSPGSKHRRTVHHGSPRKTPQPSTQVGHHVPQLGGADEAVAIAVEDLECLDELFLRVGVLGSRARCCNVWISGSSNVAQLPPLLTETSPSLACSTSGSRGWARVRTHRRVRNSECFGRRRHLHLSGHQRQELGEVNGAVSIGVDLVDHVLQLGLRRVLAQRAHHGAQLLLASAAEANDPRNKNPAADSTASSQTAKTC